MEYVMFGRIAECKKRHPPKWVFKKVKVQPRGSKCNGGGGQKISHMLVHIIRLKVTREKDAAFPYYFVPGFKTKLPIVDPCQFFKILPRLRGCFK